jgi:DNA polymerase III epsilon subunit-like protein
MEKIMTRIIALDTETTGLDVRYESVWEIAVHDVHTGEEKSWTIEPSPHTVQDMHPRAAEVNKYFDRTLAIDWNWDAPYNWVNVEGARKVYRELAEWLDGSHIIGAVPNFDTEFLAKRYQSLQVPMPIWHYHLIDVEAVAIGYLAANGIRLPLPWDSDNLSSRCGVTPPTDARHEALADARWAADLYRKVTGIRSPSSAEVDII